MSTNDKQTIQAVLQALRHAEAEDGLYFRNFFQLHEEDERDAVKANPREIIQALNSLVCGGKVVLDENDADVVFRLAAEA